MRLLKGPNYCLGLPVVVALLIEAQHWQRLKVKNQEALQACQVSSLHLLHCCWVVEKDKASRRPQEGRMQREPENPEGPRPAEGVVHGTKCQGGLSDEVSLQGLVLFFL